jgi:hypothetical protein
MRPAPESSVSLEDHVALAPARQHSSSRIPTASLSATPPALSARPFTQPPDVQDKGFLRQLPEDVCEHILRLSDRVTVKRNECVDAPDLLIVLEGEIQLVSLEPGLELDHAGVGESRLVAPVYPLASRLWMTGGPLGARIIAFPRAVVEDLQSRAPWVVSELEPQSDESHAVIGALSGEFGAQLDEENIDILLPILRTIRLSAHSVVVRQAEPVNALILVAGGSLIAGDHEITEGQVVFPKSLAYGERAPSRVTVGASGAVVLAATGVSTRHLFEQAAEIRSLLVATSR